MVPKSFKLPFFIYWCFSLQNVLQILFLLLMEFAIAVLIQGSDVKIGQGFDITYGACLSKVCLLFSEIVLERYLNLAYHSVLSSGFCIGHF